MYFSGREKEIKTITNSLEGGRNVVITGKFGIGRTSLIRHIKEMTREERVFAFADFSLEPGKISRQLLSQLSSKKNRSRQESVSARSGRYGLARFEPGRKTAILVLDNVAALTYRKLALIRFISDAGKFRFIALVEAFLPESDLIRLRAELMPSDLIRLSYLDRRSAKEFFQSASCRHHLNWSDEQIEGFLSITRGYPLGMKELVEARRRR